MDFHQEDNRKVMNKNTKTPISVALAVALDFKTYAQNQTNSANIEITEVVG